LPPGQSVNVGQQHHLLVGQFIRYLRQIRLCVRHEQIFRLCAVNGVAEAPAADSFIAPAVTTLGQLPGKAGAALAAGRDRPDQHTVADLETCDARAEFFNHTHRLMPDD
jgi:hypothetical protein